MLCLGGIITEPVEARKDKVKRHFESRYLKELDRIDRRPAGIRVESFSQDSLHWHFWLRFKRWWQSYFEPEQFQGRINDIVWRTQEMKTIVRRILWMLQQMPKSFRQFAGHSWDLVVRKWYGTHVSKPNGEWNRVAENMMIHFAETGHPSFRATSALDRGELKSKGGGRETKYYNGSEENVELTLRTIVAANQLSVYGAVADLCNEFEPDYAECEICESLVMPTEIANINATSQSSQSAEGNLLQDYFTKFTELPEDQKLSRLCKDAGLLKIENGQFFISIEEWSETMQTACRQCTQSRDLETSLPRGWDSCTYKDRSSFGCENSVLAKDVIALRSWSNHCLEIKHPHGSHCEWYQQIPHRNVRGNTEWEYRLIHQNRETFGKGSTNAKICCGFELQCSYSQPFDCSCFETSKVMTRKLRHETPIRREEERWDSTIWRTRSVVSLPRWSAAAQAQYSKFWGSVSRRDRMARAMCPWSSVEAGQKISLKIKGAWKSNILLAIGK